MSIQQPNSTQEILAKAIQSAWKQEAGGVAQFGLTHIPSRIAPAASGWTIPVTRGVPTGSAYELARVLERLQEHIESESKLSVTLFLDPFADQQKSYSQTKKAS
ncbi:MAG: hypothetical protein H7210_07265 [Pyrinomonadaceae bacterium]|nr:hypothetical protein [Phycisphaerales bacterium]